MIVNPIITSLTQNKWAISTAPHTKNGANLITNTTKTLIPAKLYAVLIEFCTLMDSVTFISEVLSPLSFLACQILQNNE